MFGCNRLRYTTAGAEPRLQGRIGFRLTNLKIVIPILRAKGYAVMYYPTYRNV
jgi:hypothetical protein